MILALADDLTGALEAGAKFAQAGLETVVATKPCSRRCEALVLDTETRHLGCAEIFERYESIPLDAELVYKKTDSTLRGNIGSEFSALSRVYPGRRILYLPAYPAMGRTVRDGCLLVDGQPLHLTAFARDPLNPMSSSLVNDSLNGCTASVEVCDAQEEDEIARRVRAAFASRGELIFAGPGNVAGHIAAQAGRGAGAAAWAPLGRVLVINGSLHPASAAQAQHGRGQGWHGWVFAEKFDPQAFDTLIVFGGDTAYEILESLGIAEITPVGEVVTGVPVSRAGGFQLITKAGGFGGDDLLTQIRERMN